MNHKRLTYILLAFLLLGACHPKAEKQETKRDTDRVYTPVDWSKNVNIYEVNVRQYTPEGTLEAFKAHIPRLKEMGVDVLWFMPIYPISEKNRKGTLGSYYAVQDYQKVNPEFGTMEEFKELVAYIHSLDMKVMLDWVANHSGWDNALISLYPDWYTQDSLGHIVIPEGTDWDDVADFNYDVPEMREYMIESLEYWVREANIDGYRCDVAGMVPNSFWVEARQRLDAIKPVLMLAEDGEPDIHEAFDMSYGWEMHHIMNEVAQGKQGVDAFTRYFAKVDTTYRASDMVMQFTSNHDENSWNGTVFERMGDGAAAFAVFSATIPGVPLIYSGQEAGLDKRLAFFYKDTIDWSVLKYEDLYHTLLTLKKEHQALWNGTYGGQMQVLETEEGSPVYAYLREKEGDKVLVLINFSDSEQSVSLDETTVYGVYNDVFAQSETAVSESTVFDLKPWAYTVLAAQ